MAFQFIATGTGTDQELLDLTRAAIAKILATGQTYSVDGRSLTMASLPELRSYAQELESKIAAAAAAASGSGPTRNLARFYRR